MTIYRSENAAFAAGGDKTASLCLKGKPNCGFRILKADKGYKVLMVPERCAMWDHGLPFYL